MSKTTKANSKSSLIRQLFNEGKSISEISKTLDSNYSFVYSVVQTYCLKNKIEMTTNNKSKSSKSDEIRKLYDDGKTIGEIAKQLNSNYSFVWVVCDKYRKELNKRKESNKCKELNKRKESNKCKELNKRKESNKCKELNK